MHPGVVQTIFLRMDRPQIDLFASDENRQLEGYCSRHQEYLAYRTDSLKMSWKNVFGYAFPLLALVHVVLDKLEQSRTLSKQCRLQSENNLQKFMRSHEKHLYTGVVQEVLIPLEHL